MRTLHLFDLPRGYAGWKARTSKRAHVFAAADGEPHHRGYDAQLAKWIEIRRYRASRRVHDHVGLLARTDEIAGAAPTVDGPRHRQNEKGR